VTARGAYREILAIRDARRLIAASAVSQLGDLLFNAALLGTVYAATGSARWVAAATICRLLPYVLLSPLGGLVADRYDRRSVLFAGAPRNATVTTLEATTLLRLEGDVLLEALQTAPTIWSALDRSNVPGRTGTAHTALVDDPAWAEA
jgi:hypothetical protein